MASTLRSFANTNARLKPTVGDMKTNALDTDHMGWLKCDGRELNTSDYAQLFSVIGYSFGGTDSTFLLPAPQGRVPGFVGQPETNGVIDVSTNVHDLGDVSGEEIHLLLLSEIPAHNHDLSGGTTPGGNGYTGLGGYTTSPINRGDGGSLTGVADDGATGHRHAIASNGGSQPHNNIQPTIWLGNLFIYSGRPWVATPIARDLIGSNPVPGSNSYPPQGPPTNLY